MVMKYRDAQRNQLANCMLLTQQENGPGGKTDTLPEVWFPERVAEEGPAYLEKHLIPADPDLWKVDCFEDFSAERKKLIRERFNFLLIPTTTA